MSLPEKLADELVTLTRELSVLRSAIQTIMLTFRREGRDPAKARRLRALAERNEAILTKLSEVDRNVTALRYEAAKCEQTASETGVH